MTEAVVQTVIIENVSSGIEFNEVLSWSGAKKHGHGHSVRRRKRLPNPGWGASWNISVQSEDAAVLREEL